MREWNTYNIETTDNTILHIKYISRELNNVLKICKTLLEPDKKRRLAGSGPRAGGCACHA
jgi:hypothetical protein